MSEDISTAGDSERETIGKLLQASKLAKYRLFQTLIKKIRDGKSLSATEQKTLFVLEQEFEAQTDAGVTPAKVFTSFDDAAAYCGLSKRTLSWHLKRGNLRQNPNGTFERTELDRFLASKGRKRRTQAGNAGDLADSDYGTQKDFADLRWRLARATREEMLVEQIKENLISRDEIARCWAARVAEVTAGLVALSERLPPLLAGKDHQAMREIIALEVHHLRDRYARDGKFCDCTL
jgi:hypothetical protein